MKKEDEVKFKKGELVGDLSHFAEKHIVEVDKTKNTLKSIEELYGETKDVVWNDEIRNYRSITNKTERNKVSASMT